MQPILHFYANPFVALHVFRLWSADVHIVWISSLDCFCHFSPQNELDLSIDEMVGA